MSDVMMLIIFSPLYELNFKLILKFPPRIVQNFDKSLKTE